MTAYAVWLVILGLGVFGVFLGCLVVFFLSRQPACPRCPHSRAAHDGRGVCDVPRCPCSIGRRTRMMAATIISAGFR